MNECLGCGTCEDAPTVTLHTGKVVCSGCNDYRRECEAREMNALPIDKRRALFAQIKEKRGAEAAAVLWSDMQQLGGKK